MCDDCQKYVPLHLHTQYSIDSVTSIKDLHKHINENKFKAVAITDHASLSACVEHYKHGMEYYNASEGKYNKPILGCEIYLYWDNCQYTEGQQYSNGKKRLAHLTLLADGDVGYKSLVTLVNRAKLRAEYGFRSPVYMSELLALNEGLVCLTGCPASLAQDDNKKIAYEFVRQLQSAFGKDRLYAEGQFHNLQSAKHFDRALELSKVFDIPLVYTNDCHYLKPDNVDEYKKFKNWVFGGNIEEDENFSLTMLYLADSEQVIDYARKISSLTGNDYTQHIEIAMQNSIKIADALGIVDMSARKPLFPDIPDNEEIFLNLIEEGIKFRNIDLTNPVYKERLDNEVGVIKGQGFIPYFIVVADLCKFANNNNIIGGVGRGSAAGSLVSYVLGITHLDPIKWNLTFERFLSKYRKALPDIDSDFSGEGRDRIVEYASRKWGFKPVATFVFFGHKEALNFAAKHCGIFLKDVEAFKEELEKNNIDLDLLDDEDEYPTLLNNFFKKHAGVRLQEMYEFVYNKCKSIGQHPGGIVYVDELAPLENKSNGGVVVALPEGSHGEYLSHRGYVKIDILGVGTLRVIQECFEITNLLPPEPIGKEKPIELLLSNSSAGIFQFKGNTMKSLLGEFKPETFMDLVVLNGAGRGGADTELYLKHRDLGSSYIWNNKIDDICKNTFGIPIFQEQFMSIYALLLNTEFDDPLNRVDKMRKSIAKFKKTPEGFKKKDDLRQEIIGLAKTTLGFDDDMAKFLWHFFDLAHGYSFNLAHSTCYSYIAWQLLWYKYNYPLIFQAATLNACYKDDMQSSIDELQRETTPIVNPDICNSSNVWVADNNKIYAPLTVIKGVGDLASDDIFSKRPYDSAKQFMESVNLRRVNSGVRFKLYMTGAFDCFDDITGNWQKDFELLDLDIKKYNGGIDKQEYLNEILEVTILSDAKVSQLNKFLNMVSVYESSPLQVKIVYGKIGELVIEQSKNPKVKGDEKTQYKLRTNAGSFLAWFSLKDLLLNPKLGNLKQGTYFACLTKYGRVQADFLEIL